MKSMTEISELTAATSAAELDSFIAAHYWRLLGLLTLKTGNRSEAEDLAQEALAKLVTNWPRVIEMDNPWGWLATVAINSSSSFWRRTIRGRRADDRLKASAPQNSSDTDAVEMLSVIGLLPPRQRKALLLRYYARFSVRETAEAMNCAEGTVKSLTHQAIDRLRTQLQEDIDHED